MLTGMSEQDWAVALEVFRAARSRRGDKGRDDRRFLEAIHFFTVENVAWRRLPAEFGNWNSVWKRFWRLSNAGVFEAFFQMLAEHSPTALVQMFDSTVVRAHVSAAGASGRPLSIQKPLSRAAKWVFGRYGPCRDVQGSQKDGWCGREDSNFHGCYPTSTSSLRVYHSATTARFGGADLANTGRPVKGARRRPLSPPRDEVVDVGGPGHADGDAVLVDMDLAPRHGMVVGQDPDFVVLPGV